MPAEIQGTFLRRVRRVDLAFISDVHPAYKVDPDRSRETPMWPGVFLYLRKIAGALGERTGLFALTDP